MIRVAFSPCLSIIFFEGKVAVTNFAEPFVVFLCLAVIRSHRTKFSKKKRFRTEHMTRRTRRFFPLVLLWSTFRCFARFPGPLFPTLPSFALPCLLPCSFFTASAASPFFRQQVHKSSKREPGWLGAVPSHRRLTVPPFFSLPNHKHERMNDFILLILSSHFSSPFFPLSTLTPPAYLSFTLFHLCLFLLTTSLLPLTCSLSH